MRLHTSMTLAHTAGTPAAAMSPKTSRCTHKTPRTQKGWDLPLQLRQDHLSRLAGAAVIAVRNCLHLPRRSCHVGSGSVSDQTTACSDAVDAGADVDHINLIESFISARQSVCG